MSELTLVEFDEMVVETAWSLKDVVDCVALLPAIAAPVTAHVSVSGEAPEGYQVNISLAWSDEAGVGQAFDASFTAPTMQWATSKAALAMRRFTENLEEQAEVGPIDTTRLTDAPER